MELQTFLNVINKYSFTELCKTHDFYSVIAPFIVTVRKTPIYKYSNIKWVSGKSQYGHVQLGYTKNLSVNKPELFNNRVFYLYNAVRLRLSVFDVIQLV